MQCSMCGYEFSADALPCHGSCPLARGCKVICCPNCGYTTVDSRHSSLVKLFAGLASHLPGRQEPQARPQDAPGVSLLKLREGQTAQVVSIEASRPDVLSQLSQYGIVPGMPVRLCQSKPVPILQIGHTELALDSEVAALVYVAQE